MRAPEPADRRRQLAAAGFAFGCHTWFETDQVPASIVTACSHFPTATRTVLPVDPDGGDGVLPDRPTTTRVSTPFARRTPENQPLPTVGMPTGRS
jgi:hypothetical protein